MRTLFLLILLTVTLAASADETKEPEATPDAMVTIPYAQLVGLLLENRQVAQVAAHLLSERNQAVAALRKCGNGREPSL